MNIGTLVILAPAVILAIFICIALVRRMKIRQIWGNTNLKGLYEPTLWLVKSILIVGGIGILLLLLNYWVAGSSKIAEVPRIEAGSVVILSWQKDINKAGYDPTARNRSFTCIVMHLDEARFDINCPDKRKGDKFLRWDPGATNRGIWWEDDGEVGGTWEMSRRSPDYFVGRQWTEDETVTFLLEMRLDPRGRKRSTQL